MARLRPALTDPAGSGPDPVFAAAAALSADALTSRTLPFGCGGRGPGGETAPDGRRVAFACDGHLDIVDSDTGLSRSLSVADRVIQLAWSTDGTRLAVMPLSGDPVEVELATGVQRPMPLDGSNVGVRMHAVGSGDGWIFHRFQEAVVHVFPGAAPVLVAPAAFVVMTG